jgi:hypothetical protein
VNDRVYSARGPDASAARRYNELFRSCLHRIDVHV